MVVQFVGLNVRPSVRPSVRMEQLPLDGCLLNLILEDFSEICWENSSLNKVWQE
jgi:hypothetical protein